MRRMVRGLAIGAGLSLAIGGAAGGADGGPVSAGRGGAPAVRVVDLGRLVADIARENADKSDVSQPFYSSAAASVHLHVLGYEQTTPLHIHRVTEEATVVVTGAPRVRLVYGREGKARTRELTAAPGTLILSPPFAAHEWVNREKQAMQANLVIAAPPFDGNFYLAASDPRVLKGAEPLVFDPQAALRSFLASGAPFRVEQLPMQREKLACVLVRDEAAIPAHPASPTLIYVVQGEGELLLDVARPLRGQLLVEIPPGTPIRARAKPGAPLVLIAFRPEA